MSGDGAQSRPDTGPAGCYWEGDRWHCSAGRANSTGIHAGDGMWLRAVMRYGEPDDNGRQDELGPGPWRQVRIESSDSGRKLVACVALEDGLSFELELGLQHELAWSID